MLHWLAGHNKETTTMVHYLYELHLAEMQADTSRAFCRPNPRTTGSQPRFSYR